MPASRPTPGVLGGRWRGRGAERVALVHLGDASTTVEPQAWQRYTADGHELALHYVSNAVFEPAGVEIEEWPDEVRATVLERVPVGAHTLVGATRSQSAALATPLGDRRVVDGLTGRPRSPAAT